MNDYFNFEFPFQPGTLARAEDVNEVFGGVEVGFDNAQVQINRSLRIPTGLNSELEGDASSRALRVVGFDLLGNLQLRSSFAYVGDWVTGQPYKQNSVYRDPVSKNLYVAFVDHTATTIAADLAAAKIALAINVADVEAARALAQSAASNALTSQNAAAGFATNSGNSASSAAQSESNAAQSALTALNAPGTSATSTTSNTLNSGPSKTFTIQTGKAFVDGQFVVIAYRLDVSKYFLAQITGYVPGTGALTVNILRFSGTGTFANWSVSLVAVTAVAASINGVDFDGLGAVTIPTNNTADNASADTHFVAFSPSSATGNNGSKVSTKLTFQPSTGNFAASGDVTLTSDERLKDNWQDVPDFVERLAQVKSGTYTRNDTGQRQVGVGAQSLQWLLPEAVHADEEGMLSVAYGNAALYACVKLAEQVQALNHQVDILSRRK